VVWSSSRVDRSAATAWAVRAIAAACAVVPVSSMSEGRAEAQSRTVFAVPRAFTQLETRQLENGLTVVLDPCPEASTVTLAVGLSVGQRDDPEGLSGLAELVGDVLAADASNDGGRAQRLRDLGALSVTHAVLSDRTSYTTRLSPASLEAALWHEAMWLATAVERLDEPTLTRQRQALREAREIDAAGIVRPVGHIGLLDPDGPYAHTEGSPDQVAHIDLAAARRFVIDHYTSRRVRLVISGRFDPAQVGPTIERTFGAIPAATAEPARESWTFVPATSARTSTLSRGVGPPRITMGWRTPPWGTTSDAALDLAASHLERSLLASLVSSGIATDVVVAHVSRELASETVVEIILSADTSQEDALAAADRALTTFRSEVVAREDFELARTRVVERLATELEDPITRTRHLLGTLTDDAGRRSAYDPRVDVARYAGLEPHDLLETAARWLDPQHRTVIVTPAGERR
jgi:zinc protease